MNTRKKKTIFFLYRNEVVAQGEKGISQEIRKLPDFCAEMKSLFHFMHLCTNKVVSLFCALFCASFLVPRSSAAIGIFYCLISLIL
jgi:hypothetical protein